MKRDGIDGSGIAALMSDAGLTNGAFYAHFRSKNDLVASVVDAEPIEALSLKGKAGTVAAYRLVSVVAVPLVMSTNLLASVRASV